MDCIRLKDKEFDIFIKEEQILEAVSSMAKQIKSDIQEADPLFVCVLNGAFMFAAELMRQLDGPYEISFVKYASYAGTSSTGRVREITPVFAEVKERMVILLEDIVDTGLTMQYAMTKFREQGATEVRLATLLFKPEALQCDLKPDYVGLKIPPDFIVGHGLDYDELGRSFRDIYRLKASDI